ncbi:MAG TPA: hypothetical protein VD861_15195, partial [Pyrinomonadaceae bacterium]|nr:hypothetical protein [Pyrinomonadaceae bacterium]
MTQTTPQATAPQPPARKLNLGRLERLQRLLQVGAALVLFVFVALIALAWTQLRDINANTKTARLKLVQGERDLASVTAELEQKQRALAAVQSVNHVLSGVADAYKEEHPEKAELVTNAVRNAVEASITQTAEQSDQPKEVTLVPPRVYIHVMNAGQRARAADVARRLQAKGFLVPGVENMERKGTRLTQSDVRFSPGAGMEAADTASIRDVLDGFGVRLREVWLFDSTRPRQYELWLGDDFAGQEGTTRPEVIPGLGTRPARTGADTS